MQSITLDILNAKAFNILKDLESLHLIRLHSEAATEKAPINWADKYKGAMAKQSLADIDSELDKLRSEWE